MNGLHCHRISYKSKNRREVWSKLHRLNKNTFSKLTPQSGVVLKKLTLPQPVKKFPALYAIQQFITMFTTACHVREELYPVHAILFLQDTFILIPNLHLCLPDGPFATGFPTKILYALLFSTMPVIWCHLSPSSI
jgi:hypothetical protein